MTIAMIVLAWAVAGLNPGTVDSNSNDTTPAPVAEPTIETSDEEADPSPQQSDRSNDAVRRLLAEGLSEFAPSKELWDRLVEATSTMLSLQRDLAKTNMSVSGIQRELDDLRQFILDHDTYGKDFDSYTKVLEETRRQRRAAATRERREQDEANRKRREEAKQRLDAAKSRNDLEKLYDERGFAPVGQDVYTSRAAFYYGPRDGEDGKTIRYVPSRFGRLQPVTVASSRELDYARMTISGSVLNGSKNIRSMGVAFTFFDEHGNQVGAEIVEIQNARPNVPYPFTKKIDMALNRPFATHSTYVLYADQVVKP